MRQWSNASYLRAYKALDRRVPGVKGQLANHRGSSHDPSLPFGKTIPDFEDRECSWSGILPAHLARSFQFVLSMLSVLHPYWHVNNHTAYPTSLHNRPLDIVAPPRSHSITNNKLGRLGHKAIHQPRKAEPWRQTPRSTCKWPHNTTVASL